MPTVPNVNTFIQLCLLRGSHEELLCLTPNSDPEKKKEQALTLKGQSRDLGILEINGIPAIRHALLTTVVLRLRSIPIVRTVWKKSSSPVVARFLHTYRGTSFVQ